MKPIIGILMRPDELKSGNKIMCAYEDIRKSIVNSGGIPLGIMSTNDDFSLFDDSIIKIIDLCDGIIFQGGDHFYDYDMKCLDYVYKNNKPSLGICLGMQLMGCYFDGKLIEIKNHLKQASKYTHSVYLNRDSKLYSILGKSDIKVNSRHKDALLYTDLKIVGLSKEGSIEAIEDSNKKFFIGVQWHPENMYSYDILEQKIFNAFIKACRV